MDISHATLMSFSSWFHRAQRSMTHGSTVADLRIG
jgi:hypothetical protein